MKLFTHFTYTLAKRGEERKRRRGEMRRMSNLFKGSLKLYFNKKKFNKHFSSLNTKSDP